MRIKRRSAALLINALFLHTLLASLNCAAAFSEEEFEYYIKEGYQPLYDEQDGDYPENTYLINGDVTVKRGKTLTFYPGSRIIVTKNARIQVEGTLICQGTPLNKITFSRLENEKYFYPVEQDIDTRWGGIFVHDDARAELSHSIIEQSKYGIEATPGYGSIVLDSVVMRNNRYQHLKVGGAIISVDTDKPLSLTFPVTDTVAVAKQHSARTQSQSAQAPSRFRPKLMLRIGLGTVTVGAGIAAISLHAAANSDKATYQKTGDNEYDSSYARKATHGNIWAVIALLSAAGFGITMFF
ncbi:MAG: hypothetical protein GF398_17425 [Chitinivibrionales bacterium]|nr:hypothetical protein [Chitinivibrionales bacterium]